MQNSTSLRSNSAGTQEYSSRSVHSINMGNPSPSPLRNGASGARESEPPSVLIREPSLQPRQCTERSTNRASVSRGSWTSSLWYRRKFRSAKSYGSMKSVHCVESCIRIMDQIHNSNFQDWIQDPRNAEYVAGRLRPIVAEYDLSRAACALQWLCKSWTSYECLALFHRLTKDWNIKDQKALADQLVKNDNLRQPASCQAKRTAIARPTTGSTDECQCACGSNWSRTRRYRSRETSPSSSSCSSRVPEFNYGSRDPLAEFARQTQTGRETRSGDGISPTLTTSMRSASAPHIALPQVNGSPGPSRNRSNIAGDRRQQESSGGPMLSAGRHSTSREGFTGQPYASPGVRSTMSCRRQKSNESLNECFDRRGGESLSDLTFAEMFDRQNQDMQL